MTFRRKIKPTESELEILQVLWEHGPSSVRFVNELLNHKREVGYTTTLKIMQIMNEKELVQRDTDSRTHIYTFNVSENATQRNLLKSFIDKTYKGSAMRLVMQALGSDEVSKEDIEELKKIIKKFEEKK